MSWSVHIKGLDTLAGELQAAARLGVHDGMELLGVEGQRMVQDNIASPYNGHPARVDRGNLLNSVLPEVQDDQALVRLTIGVAPTAGADRYAAPVETGARPHTPPIEVLVAWVKRKLGVGDEKRATSIAWAISKTIAKRGTAAQDMFARALVDLEPKAAPVLERAIAARLIAAGAGATR